MDPTGQSSPVSTLKVRSQAHSCDLHSPLSGIQHQLYCVHSSVICLVWLIKFREIWTAASLFFNTSIQPVAVCRSPRLLQAYELCRRGVERGMSHLWRTFTALLLPAATSMLSPVFICIIHWHLLVPCTKYRPCYWIWISAPSHIRRPRKYIILRWSNLI